MKRLVILAAVLGAGMVMAGVASAQTAGPPASNAPTISPPADRRGRLARDETTLLE